MAFATDEESRSKSPTGDGDVEIADGKQSPEAQKDLALMAARAGRVKDSELKRHDRTFAHRGSVEYSMDDDGDMGDTEIGDMLASGIGMPTRQSSVRKPFPWRKKRG